MQTPMPRERPLLCDRPLASIRMFPALRKPFLIAALCGCVATGSAYDGDRPDEHCATRSTTSLSPAQQLIERGQERLTRGEYAAARTDFDRAWHAGDHSPEVHRHLVRCLVGEQKLSIAKQEAMLLLEEHPELAAVHVTLAQIAFLSEDYPQAIRHASTAIAQNARLADACFIRAYALARLGDLEAALADVRHSVSDEERDSDFRAEAPHLLHGANLEQLQRHQEALLVYERALRVNERSTAALLGQWTCYQQLQMVPAAFLVANEMRETSPKAVETLQACAVSHRQFNEYEVAAQYAARWREIALSDPRPCVEQSRSMIAMRQWQLARKTLDEALIRDHNHLPALVELSRLLISCPDDAVRDAGQAQQLAQRACELSDWESPPLIATLAATYAAQGDSTQAAALLDRCLTLLPIDDDSQEIYAELRHRYVDGHPTQVADETGADRLNNQ